MLTLLNIGNTHAQPAIWHDGYLELLPRIPTSELTWERLPQEYPVAAASVVPKASARLAGHGIYFLSAYDCGGLIDFSRVDPTTLGADRVANAIAAAEFYPLPALVVDCGTAITIEIVDERRRFLGGAIAPGRRLMRRALFEGTAQLPEIPFSQELPEEPGRNTVEAIRFGVDRGAVGLVRELVAASLRSCGIVSCLAAGGDAGFYAAALPELKAVESDFTLHGIRLAWERRRDRQA